MEVEENNKKGAMEHYGDRKLASKLSSIPSQL